MSPEAKGLLRFAGFLIWSLTGLPLFVSLVQVPELLQQPRYWLWLTCFFVFGATFGLTRWNVSSPQGRRLQLASLATQTTTAPNLAGSCRSVAPCFGSRPRPR
jgi:hypothetical protein